MALELPASIPDPEIGVPYSHAVVATGGTEPYFYEIKTNNVASRLPKGLSMTSEGVISGTPTESFSYPVNIVVTDALTYALDKWYTMRVSGKAVFLSHDLPPAYAEGDPVELQVTAGRGVATAARFNSPHGVAADSNRNLFVCDTGNHTIRKIEPDGTVTTFAGIAGTSGATDGTGPGGLFSSPAGITIDASDNLYISDTGNHTIRKITPAAEVTTIAGFAGDPDLVDDTGNAARFNAPTYLTIDASGTLYVLDQTHTVIRQVTSAGVVTTHSGLTSPADGPLYFNDALNRLYLLYDDGAYLYPYLVTWNYTGDFLEHIYTQPVNSFTIDSLHNMYVCQENGTRIVVLNYVTGGSAGLVGDEYYTTRHGGYDGYHATALLGTVTGMYAGALGHVYITENEHTVRELTYTNYGSEALINSSRWASARLVTRAGVYGASGDADDTAQYTYSFGIETTIPPELSLSSGGLITGTCPAGQNTVYVYAEDTEGNIGYTALSINANTLHVTTPCTILGGSGVTYFSEPVSVTGGYEPYTWAIVGDLPDGFLFNESTGYFTGGSQKYGMYHCGVQVTDSNPNPSLVQSILIPIDFHIQDGPLLIGGGCSTTENPAYVGVPFALAEAAIFVGGTLPYSTFGVTDNVGPGSYPLPAWLVFTPDNVNNVVSLSGTPDVKGFVPYAVFLTDGNNIGPGWNATGAIGVSDPAEGSGGYGVPHIEYLADPVVPVFSKETGVVDPIFLGGYSSVYGGYPPYTITNIGDPLPAGLSYDLEQRAWGALPFLVGTTSQQGRFDLAFRITDSASTLGAFTDNSVDYVGTVEIYKTLMIAHTVLNVGTIEIPYKYKITDNYAPGDVDYPTAYGIESGGQGFLPTGYVCYHDPDTHENFIQGTTTFSNAFPITLGGYTARYSGGVPRATWNTVLLVGGVVVLTHEVL